MTKNRTYVQLTDLTFDRTTWNQRIKRKSVINLLATAEEEFKLTKIKQMYNTSIWQCWCRSWSIRFCLHRSTKMYS